VDFCRDLISGYSIDITERGFDLEEEETMEVIDAFKQKLVTLLNSLLEGEPDPYIILRMTESIDFDVLRSRLCYVYKTFIIK
jgi:hypothetical protein